jgi:uncharacterized protein (TIGR02646 family)
MRRIVREALDAATNAALSKRQADADRRRADGTLNVNAVWKAARQDPDVLSALAALRQMAGGTERCMYCLDSHGTDVEHFWPKARFPERLFTWTNLLLGCTECGRFKGDRFPLDAGGEPLLVDPTSEDPWEHLEFDSVTGNLTARFDRKSGRRSRKGEMTVALLQLDRREALARVYRRGFLRLREVVEAATAATEPDPSALLTRLRDADDYGLLGWCFSSRGTSDAALAELQDRFPAVWQACAAGFARP